MAQAWCMRMPARVYSHKLTHAHTDTHTHTHTHTLILMSSCLLCSSCRPTKPVDWRLSAGLMAKMTWPTVRMSAGSRTRPKTMRAGCKILLCLQRPPSPRLPPAEPQTLAGTPKPNLRVTKCLACSPYDVSACPASCPASKLWLLVVMEDIARDRWTLWLSCCSGWSFRTRRLKCKELFRSEGTSKKC